VRLGLGGDKTENVLWRIEHGELNGLSPKVLVLLIGTNNLADEATTPIMTARGIAKILAEIRQRLPSTRVLLLGVLPREPESAHPLRSKVRTTNLLIARFADGVRVRYLDVGARLIGADGRISPAVMQDFLHPTAEGYRLVAEALEPELREMLAESR
jgi:lysophospholipase L1-like esterase